MGVRIVVRRGDVVPDGENLDVGELMLDTGRVRLGIGLGGQQPVWLPGVSPVTKDLLLNPLQGIQGAGFGQNYWIGWPGDDFLQIRRNGYLRFGIAPDYNILQGVTLFKDGARTDRDIMFGTGAGIPDFGASVIRNRPGKSRIYFVVNNNDKPVGIAKPDGFTTRTIEDMAYALGAQQESLAELTRQLYASGILGVRAYRPNDKEAFNMGAKSSINGFSVMNVHNHPDFKATLGLAEITALVNGYLIKTRHNDYRLMHSIQGAFGEREENEAVPVPSSVSVLPTGFSGATLTSALPGTQVHWMRNVYEDNPEQCIVEMSYLEMWIQRWTGEAIDMATSARHVQNGVGFKNKLQSASYYSHSGLNASNENNITPNGVIVTADAEGFPVLGYINYRISSIPVATLSPAAVSRSLPVRLNNGTIQQRNYQLRPLPYDPELAIKGIVDTRNRIVLRRRNQSRMFDLAGVGGVRNPDSVWTLEQLLNSSQAAFDTPDMAELCRMCPGFDGYDQEERMVITDPSGVQAFLTGRVQTYNSVNPRGFGFYDNRYAIDSINAVGLKMARRGYSDQNLFTAHTNHPEVVGGWSWMIPMELIIRTPRETWNPTNIPRVVTSVGKGTAADPFTGYHEVGRYFTIPKAAIVPDTTKPVTQADTFTSTWLRTGSNVAIECWANGLSLFDWDGKRRRFPVMPEASMFTAVNSEMQAFKERLIPILREIRAGRATFDQINDLI